VVAGNFGGRKKSAPEERYYLKVNGGEETRLRAIDWVYVLTKKRQQRYKTTSDERGLERKEISQGRFEGEECREGGVLVENQQAKRKGGEERTLERRGESMEKSSKSNRPHMVEKK